MAIIGHITFACDDPDELATFWEAALDAERSDLLDGTDAVLVERETGADLLFRAAPRGTERDLPIHLDLAVEDRGVAVERLRDLGASVRETNSEEFEGTTNTWTVMEDPAGNGFCVADY
jgi:catechol 2,3-dioxygenase-like lactoylglutathione lyase family enzyme